MKLVLSFKEFGYNIYYLLPRTKSSHLISALRGWFLTWTSGLLGLRTRFVCLFSSPATIRCFLLVNREGLDLKIWSFGVESTFVYLFSSPKIFIYFRFVERKGLNLGRWSSRLRARLCVLVLFTRDLQLSCFSFRREGLDLEGLSLKKWKFDLRESFLLRSDSSSPWWE